MIYFWREVWNMSEFYGISLGRFAPFVFMRMTGLRGALVANVTEQEKQSAIIMGNECGAFKARIVSLFGAWRSLCAGQPDTEPITAYRFLFQFYSFPCKVNK